MPGLNERSAAPADRTVRLRAELVAARDELMTLLAQAGRGSLTTPGLVGEWSGRELVAHVGYWAGHAIEVIQAVERGTTDLLGEGQPSVDEINATVARVARQSDLIAVQKREAATFMALVDRLTALDPDLLDHPLPDGATLEEGVREDGAAHYREHAVELQLAVGHGS